MKKNLALLVFVGTLTDSFANQSLLKRGESLYRNGDFAKHISACISCHGPSGTGNEEAGFPLIRGQHTSYVVKQLQDYKTHKRENDLNSIMREISKHMSQEDMKAVADYIHDLD